MTKPEDQHIFLIVEDNESISEIIALELEGQWEKCEVIKARSGNQAIDIIKSRQDLSCIVSDLNMEEGSGIDFYNFLSNFNITIPFLFISGDHIDHHKGLKSLKDQDVSLKYLKKPFSGEELVNHVADLLSMKIDYTENKFKRISLDRFEIIKDFPIDLYLKKSNEQFVKLTKGEDGYIDEFGEIYKQRGLSEIYTPTSEYIKLIEYLDDFLAKRIQNKSLTTSHKIKLQLSSIKHIHESLIGLGFKESALDLAKQNITSCLDLVQSNENLAVLLSNIISNERLKFSLGLLTSYISITMACQTTWASRALLEKLALAGIFQDIGLEGDELLKIKSDDSDEFNALSYYDQKKVLEHSQKSVEAVEILDFSTDLRNLILYHHERPNQTGFPFKRFDNSLPPIICINILANEFSYCLIKKPLYQEDLTRTFNWMEKNCQKGNFKKAFDAFKASFKAGLNKKGLSPK